MALSEKQKIKAGEFIPNNRISKNQMPGGNDGS
ncbi:hypothetical protein N875_01500 [Neisseria meningitidis LNP21362]|uniref:Uncharacterized protein n=1 Tax=Neisseria meningitidis alpha522 TaxID=996307 RepID=I4E5V8_NEIME|nr:hypothetical protein N875_01500 [Neisseria meningitidis LNP21362]KID52700.1 hypothetical protein N872_10170 [Neisseria meningitidis LNP27256]CCA44724.1 hypothetical protein NMALPHA522_1183 [Neisseria meningitidis alpha522]